MCGCLTPAASSRRMRAICSWLSSLVSHTELLPTKRSIRLSIGVGEAGEMAGGEARQEVGEVESTWGEGEETGAKGGVRSPLIEFSRRSEGDTVYGVGERGDWRDGAGGFEESGEGSLGVKGGVGGGRGGREGIWEDFVVGGGGLGRHGLVEGRAGVVGAPVGVFVRL